MAGRRRRKISEATLSLLLKLGLDVGLATFNESRDGQNSKIITTFYALKAVASDIGDVNKFSPSSMFIDFRLRSIKIQVHNVHRMDGEKGPLEPDHIFLIGSMIQSVLIQYQVGFSRT